MQLPPERPGGSGTGGIPAIRGEPYRTAPRVALAESPGAAGCMFAQLDTTVP